MLARAPNQSAGRGRTLRQALVRLEPARAVPSESRGLVGTRGDALRMYLTGAGADGGSQAIQAASLGGYRSSTQCGGLGYMLRNPIANARIDYASAANGEGVGLLEALEADWLRWTPPGGLPGPAVYLANGASAILEGASALRGLEAASFIRVTRTSSAALSGAAAVQVLRQVNDVLGQGNIAAGGGATYRCICLKASAGCLIQDLRVWIHGAGLSRIGLEDPSAQPAGYFQSIANESAAPAGISWAAPTHRRDAAVLVKSSLQPNQQVGVWIERQAPAAASAWVDVGIGWSFTAIG